MFRTVRTLCGSAAIAVVALLALPNAAAHAAAATASLSPSSGLHNGDTVTITYSGMPANAAISAIQCDALKLTKASQCDVSNIASGTSDASGAGTLSFKVRTGPIGAGQCDGETHNTCTLAVGDNAKTTSVIKPISFASTAATEAPKADNANSANDDHSVLIWTLVVAAVVLVLAVVGALRLRRR